MDTDAFKVKAGTSVDLGKIDPRSTPGWAGNKEEAANHLSEQIAKIVALQEVLYAQGTRRVLIVLQAMDGGGKDGTIRTVFDGINPQGVRVASFKGPTDAELAHDYLWRVHPHVPGSGEIVLFNRSHYEDVLVVAVHELVAEAHWRRRYRHIRDFEQLLTDEGTTVIKFFLHISKEEQRLRLQERLDDPRKRWKFTKADLAERERWSDYQHAYERAISETSTDDSPWYIVPADRNWFRNLVVAEIVSSTLEGLDLRYPPAESGLEGLKVT